MFVRDSGFFVSKVRGWFWVGGFVLSLTVGGVLLSLSRSSEFGVDTPEGVVQRYLQKVADRDWVAASEFLSERLEGCELVFPDGYELYENYRVDWVRTDRPGDLIAVVGVEVTRGSDGFFGDRSPEFYSFSLRREGGVWRVLRQTWPWRECSEDTFVSVSGV